jgi:2-oxoglutarate ferredoxin oxidoreductase subunit beta
MARAMQQYLRPGIPTTPFCPGCGHGILLGLILRSIDAMEIDIREMLFVSGIGCAAWIPSPHFNADTFHTTHGRAIAFATGAKLYNPKLRVMVISGDGDLSSIGGNHLIHAARRDIDLKVICANNMIYGMTGGQVAATTPLGSTTSTTPLGNPYRPFDLCRLVEAAGGKFVARHAVTQPLALVESIKKSLSFTGFTFIEVLSPCATQFGSKNLLESAPKMMKWLMENCVTREEAEELSQEELEGKIITGEWGDVEGSTG